MAVSDTDTAPDELEFELVEAPIHGELIKTEGSTHTSMTNGGDDMYPPDVSLDSDHWRVYYLDY